MNIVILILFFFLSFQPVSAETPAHPQLRRHTTMFVRPNGSYDVALSFHSDQDFTGNLIEKVPYSAVVASDGPVSIKNLTDLHLRFPFDDESPVTLPFGQVDPDNHFGIGLHDGVDFAMPEGTPIVAVDDGEIAPYREQNHYGTTVAVQHAWGQTFYGHLSKTDTQIGQKVRKGEIIGSSGNTGLSSGPHLHFGMKYGDQFVNALPHLAKQNNEKIAQKSLIWNFSSKKGDQLNFSYQYSLPDAYKERGILTLGPATVISNPSTSSGQVREQVMSREEKEWQLVLTDNPGSIEALANDPNANQQTFLAVLDNVVLWINSDQRMIHGFDMETSTKFEIPFNEDKKTSFLIDTTEYLAWLNNDELELSLAP